MITFSDTLVLVYTSRVYFNESEVNVEVMAKFLSVNGWLIIIIAVNILNLMHDCTECSCVYW